jgi:hypothetical protein
MLSRALSSATVTLLIGCFAAIPAQAQNLEAGKSPSQIFAGTCAACHKSPRGLLKSVSSGSLPGFLRQHYTTSGDMASLLAGFLVSNGAADTRHVETPPRQARDKDAKSEGRPAGPPDQLDRFGRRLRPGAPRSEPAEPQQAARPDADGLAPQADAARQGRNAKRLARPGEPSDPAKPAVVEGQAPAQATGEAPDGRKSAAKQQLGKKGRPGSEPPPKTDAAKGEPSGGGPVGSETAKGEASKPEGAPPSGEATSEAAKIDAPSHEGGGSGTPVLRADPVPPVTPAPPASPAASATASSENTPSASPSASAMPAAPPAAPAMTASAPPPVPPAGPPAPPISQ